MYRSILGKRPLPGKRPCPCTAFQGATVAASIQMCGILIPGKRPCGPKLLVMFKRLWVFTQDTTVSAIESILPSLIQNSTCTYMYHCCKAIAPTNYMYMGNWTIEYDFYLMSYMHAHRV